MSTGKKEYLLKINGVKQSITDVTTLDKALEKLGATVTKTNAAEAKKATASRQTAKALTDEEKAAAKLAATRKKLEQLNTAGAKEQIVANQLLRERTRELNRQVAAEQLAEDSIKALGMRLTDLRNEYGELSAADRHNIEIGGELLAQIQELDKQYKSLKESTGDYRDSVGNYEKATQGLEKLRGGLDSAGSSALGLAANFGGTNGILYQFGGAANEASESLQKLQMITALVGQITAAYTAIAKDNYIQEQARKATDSVRIVQLRAKAAAEAVATKNTIAATIAQKAFNLVANANPYILLATALIAVGSALWAFSKSAADATEAQDKLNASTKDRLDLLESAAAREKARNEDFAKSAQNELELARTQGKKLEDIRKIENKIAEDRKLNNLYNRGLYANEIKNIEKNKDALLSLEAQLRTIQRIKAEEGEDFEELTLWAEIDGKQIEGQAEKILETLQNALDNTTRKIKVATEVITEDRDIAASEKLINAQRLAEDKKLAKERASVERAALRASEDARISLIRNGFDQQRKALRAQNRREIEDLQLRLKEEENLSDKARKAINDNIVSLRKKLNVELQQIAEQQKAFELSITRQTEDTRTQVIKGELEQRQTEIRNQYAREIEDLQTRLRTDKSLTEKSRQAINESIINLEKAKNAELEKLTADDLQRRADLELAAVESRLTASMDRIEALTVRSKKGFNLIDVQATKANLNEANAAYDEYITGLTNYAADAKAAHEETLSTLQAGTVEYAAEQQRYADVINDVTKKIRNAQKEQQDNAKENSEIVLEYYKELFNAIAKVAGGLADTITTVLSTVSMAIEYQLEDLNKKLEATDEYYQAAKERSESAAKNVEDLEEQIQDSTGGTTEALQEQLAEAMRARNASLREERRLAREKEKLEADIAKKERQQRKLELSAQIAQAIANTAQGVSKALSDWIFPANLIIAGIVGAAGALQVGIMTRQLAKLEKGGEIIGPSHANGGVPLSGSAGQYYEAEGGEFMVNKTSYAANRNLVQAINESSGPLSMAELLNATGAPDYSDTRVSGEDRLVNAIQNITIQPKVAVTEIDDVRSNMARVEELAGF